MIKTEKLKKSLGGKVIIEGANIEVKDGEFVGVYGESGIGKSTLAKILCGVMPADEGSVWLDGERIYSAGGKYNRKKGVKIQMVYQQPYSALDPRQKIISGFRELIRYHRLAGGTMTETEIIESISASVGLEMDILSHLPHQISGGEAQRIALAKCLLFAPRLLILDEATSMLDVSTQANVLALVRREMEKSGGSVMLISHDRQLVNHVCGRVYEFDGNLIKEN